MNELGSLKLKILGRFGSLHAFAKSMNGRIGRSTVYQIFSGKYAGNIEKQFAKIEKIIDGPGDIVFEILRDTACGRCLKSPKRKKKCEKCFETFRAQETALTALQGGSHGQKN